MKRADIIMLALPRWDGPYASTSFALASELAKKNRVFYIDNPFTISEVFRKIKTKEIKRRMSALLMGRRKFTKSPHNLEGLICVTPLMVLPINFLPRGSLYNFFVKVNDFIVYRSIKSLKRQFGVSDFIFINSYNPFYSLYFSISFKPSLKIYHCVDDISESNYVNKHGSYLEERMIKKFDLTLTTSSKLTKKKKKISANVYYLPNAADFMHFNTGYNGNYSLPEVNTSGKTIVGYIGNICQRIDYDILKFVIQDNPEKLFLMVGPVTNKGIYDKGIDQLPNIRLLGPRSYQVLPQYLSTMDCAIIPFVRNELTSSIYPLKINEYLASGTPVVSTDFSEDILQFSEVISIANEANSFSAKVKEEVSTNDTQKELLRIEEAGKNTWEERARTFWNIVGRHNKSSGL